MTSYTATSVLSLLLVFPPAASAQFPAMTPWWNGNIASDLGLSNRQLREIRATVRQSRDGLIRLRATVHGTEADLRDELNEPRVDSAKADAAIERVVAARSELIRAVARMSLRLRLILTTAQWQELQRRQNRPFNAPGSGGAGKVPRRGAGPE